MTTREPDRFKVIQRRAAGASRGVQRNGLNWWRDRLAGWSAGCRN